MMKAMEPLRASTEWVELPAWTGNPDSRQNITNFWARYPQF